jgi:Family of unknown function (DUF6788)
MPKTLEELESFRDKLRHQLLEIGDFQAGTIYPRFRKCGKKNCVCSQLGHPGHGPQYLRTTAKGGKNRAENLRIGPELEKAVKEAQNYQRFVGLCRELVDVNEQICKLRPLREIRNQEELDSLKKKLQRQFAGKLRRK